MRAIRNRTRALAAVALMWHIVAMGAVPTVLACEPTPGAEIIEHSAMAGHEGMVDCPMQRHEQPMCPKHGAGHGSHECDCPTLRCAQTDTGFMAVFGSVGILPTPAIIAVPFEPGLAVFFVPPHLDHFAYVPLFPPPRA